MLANCYGKFSVGFQSTQEGKNEFLIRLSKSKCKKFRAVKHKSNNSLYVGHTGEMGRPTGLGLILYENGNINAYNILMINRGQFSNGKMNGLCVINIAADTYIG